MFSAILLTPVLAIVGFEIGAEALVLDGDFEARNVTLQKRYDNARFTFFDTGLGACGGTNQASDFIVALNEPQYGNGEHCYEMIEITYNGKTAQAQIVDECPGCPYGGLDFSRGLFDHFASEDLGVIYGTWVFSDGGGGGGGGGGEETTTKQTSKAASTQHPKQTSTQASTPTSTLTPTLTPTLTSTPTSSSLAVASSTMASATAAPAAVVDGNLEGLQQVLGSFVELLVIGAASNSDG